MSKLRMTFLLAAILLFSTSLFAQATRTWVSGVGDDANPCSRTAPCKTFAGAISKTANGGEIDALDPGGFGAVTIGKSITLDGQGTLASILNPGFNGVIINAANITVNLRNLTINGAGTGTNGVRVLNATHVNLQNVAIYGQSGRAVSIEQSTAIQVNIEESKFFQNLGSAFVILPGGTNVRANIVNSSISNNGVTSGTSDGIFIQNSNVMVRNSEISGNTLAGAEANTGGNLFLDNCSLSNNTFEGVRVSGGTARLARSAIFNNANGATSVSAGTLFTFGDNYIGGNPVNNGVSLTAASPAKQ